MTTSALAGGARETQTKRIAPAQMQADMDAYKALQGIENYIPANTAYTLELVGENWTQ